MNTATDTNTNEQSDSTSDQAIGMTVYDMPGQGAAQHSILRVPSPRSIRRGRLQLIALLLVCLSPVIASYFTYYVIKPSGQPAYGQLVLPLRPTPDVGVTAAAPFPASAQFSNLLQLKGQWILLSIAPAACDEVCQKHLYLQRQMRESLGKDKDRLDWVWLVSDAAQVDSKLLPALEKASVLRVPEPAVRTWLQLESQDDIHNYLYVIDPMGNYMMRFPANLDAKKALSDIGKLLRASNSWDNEGRG